MSYLYFKFEIRITNDKAKMMMAHLLKANYPAAVKKNEGFIFNAMLSDSSSTMGIRIQMRAEVISQIIGVIVLVILLVFISPIYLILLPVLIPLYIVLTLGFRKTLERLQVDERANADKLFSVNKNIISNKRSINILGANSFFLIFLVNHKRTGQNSGSNIYTTIYFRKKCQLW